MATCTMQTAVPKRMFGHVQNEVAIKISFSKRWVGLGCRLILKLAWLNVLWMEKDIEEYLKGQYHQNCL